MSSIRDEDFILYYYRDELEPKRFTEIEEALAADPELRKRYEALRLDLERAGSAFGNEEPEPGFEDRVWRAFEAKLHPSVDRKPGFGDRVWQTFETKLRSVVGRKGFPWRRFSRGRFGLLPHAMGVALGVGLAVGRMTAPSLESKPLLAANAGPRLLGVELVRHLESTERTLLVAARNPQDAELVSELADALLESHRLYALAADRAGRHDLAEFLRELEPILLRLAHADTLEEPEAVQESIVRRDLPFKIRVVAAAARRDLMKTTPERL